MERFGERIHVGVRFSATGQTGPGTHSAYGTVGPSVSFPQGKGTRDLIAGPVVAAIRTAGDFKCEPAHCSRTDLVKLWTAGILPWRVLCDFVTGKGKGVGHFDKGSRIAEKKAQTLYTQSV